MIREDTDREVRLAVYRWFVERGEAPSVDETASALDLDPGEVASSLARLEAAHVLVLEPGTSAIQMANPFSAVPTAFRVETATGSWWGNCVWDAFGILAMLDSDGTVSTACADCGNPMELRVHGGVLRDTAGVAHFAVPARHWRDDIGYT